MKFDWDEGNRPKCSARVPIQEIEAVISDDDTTVITDPYQGEPRYRAVGQNADGRGVFVVFTKRVKDEEVHIRPINVHYIHSKEMKKTGET